MIIAASHLTGPALFKALLVSTVFAVISGCATQPRMPIAYYQPPATGATATIIGSDELNVVPFLFDNYTVHIEGVDGLPVREPRTTGKNVVTLPAGVRRVRVVHQMGAFYGGTLLEFTAKAGASYRAFAQQDLEGTTFWNRPLHGIGGPTFFWIEDLSTGEKVTEQVRAMVGSQQSQTIPIFIPRGK